MNGLNFNKTYSLEAVDRKTARKGEADNSHDDGFDESSFDEDSLTFSFTFPGRYYISAIFEVHLSRVHIYTNYLTYRIFPP